MADYPFSGPMIEVPGNDREVGLCSDDGCPCGYPGASIPRGTGYMYVSKEVAEIRASAPSVAEMEAKISQMQAGFGGMIFAGSGVFAPILMCEQGAKKRGINLDVAAYDARTWWSTGKVACRPTPQAGVSPDSGGCFVVVLLAASLAGSLAAAVALVLSTRS